MKILLATQNLGKYKEIKRMLEPLGVEVILPEEKLNVEEKGNSFMENAYIKAMAYFEKYRIPTLADDSGLVVPSLGGYPGVFSSRFYSIDWGGKEEVQTSEDEANIKKLLRLMRDVSDRRAYFKAVLCLVLEEGLSIFSEGTCEGEIVHSPRGSGGFGYDPIFKPKSYEKTMAELSPEEKDLISHRGKALRKLKEFLELWKKCR
ncbi:RdgB/HAM1 family non-canonical purine NTP pyrophosphatase [Thermocrinis sp.]|jgi:XTP/dITP diphosphohydrolase|uniref:RdgB/HAM1 family non-canonical purine NTP pyrophosphatase n=1 Tax=Thermocrinis sp. TaxID=2024383 RepID=UPI002608B040|nr:RdgB/HAM1 family non-canonical purine NTP pyrophosphatase [Thermocrinis sp.]